MKILLFTQRVPVFMGVVIAAILFVAAGDAFALSYSPSTIYPGTPYTLSEFVSNSSGSTISVTKDCFYWKNGVYGGSWSNGSVSVPPGGATATCSSTGDTAGSQMSFQMNIWRPDYSGTVSWSTTGFTVQSLSYSLSVSTSGSGSVSCNGSSCASSYPSGTSLTLSASPSSGYTFSGWGGACFGTSSCSLTMDSNKSVTASFAAIPTYSLSVSKVGSGYVSGGGIDCGMSCSNSYTAGTSVQLFASPSSGYRFAGWSGCDSTSGSSCTLAMNGARSASVSFEQLVASASFINPGSGTTLNYNGGTYFTWTSTNTTGCSISTSPTISGYPKTGLPSSNSGTAYWSGNLKDNVSFTLTCTPISGASGSPSSEVVVNVNPPPSGTCTVNVNNKINHTSGFGYSAWEVTATGSAGNCPSSYFTDLTVSGNASPDRPPVAVRVFDTGVYGGAFFPGSACPYLEDLQVAGGNALQNSGTGARPCSGGGTFLRATGALHFQTSLTNLLSATAQGLNVGYTNDDPARQAAGNELFYHGALPWGNYNFHISNTLSGNYLCPDGSIVPINTGASVRVCAYEGEDGGGQYFDSQCVPQNPSDHVQTLSCLGVPNVGVTLKFTCTNCPPPPPPAPSLHILSVQSKLDGASKPGVQITQVSVSDPDPNFSFPTNYFAGTTDYTQSAERNLTVVLEAPQTHISAGGSFTGWTGECAPIAGNARQCEVSFVFSVLGGQKKTVIANYSSSLSAPVVLTSPASCDANGGKVNITLQSAVSGATGYKLYRKSAASSFSLIKTFTTADAPVSGTTNAPFLDSGMTAGTSYYYKMEAYNSSITSAASAEASRAASLPCPDLMVESISIKKADGTAAPTPIISGTALRFSASIKNQGGPIPSTISFRNQFVRDGNTTDADEGSLSGLGQGLSATVETTALQAWTATNGQHSIEVCADRPPATPGLVDETAPNETNNCATLNFSVLAPLKVDLECKKPDGVYDSNYCIVDYAQTSGLRWTVTGSPSVCAGKAGTDLTNAVTPQSHTVSGNPLSLTDLLSKLNFQYQLECSR